MADPNTLSVDPQLEKESRTLTIVAVNGLALAVTTIIIALRLTTRIWIRPRLAWDDAFCFISWVLCTTAAGTQLAAASVGFGRHFQFLTEAQQHRLVMWCQLCILFDSMALLCIKISICCFIFSIIKRTHQHLRWATYVLVTITTASGFALIFMWGFQAQPLKKLWDPDTPGTVAPVHRILDLMFVGTLIFNMTDLFYALTPTFFLAGVQMERKKKLTVIGLTGCGLLVFAVSIIRLVYCWNFLKPDPSWNWVDIYLWCHTEITLAIVIACLPTLVPLWAASHAKARSWSERSRQRDGKDSAVSTDVSNPSMHNKAFFVRATHPGKFGQVSVCEHEVQESRWSSEASTTMADEPRRPSSAVLREDDNVIRVKREFTIQTHERRDSGDDDLDSQLV